MALLGKISAVLTASTTDFTRKIGNAKEDLKSLEKRVSGTRLSLDTRSLDGTLTKLQQFKRTLEEVRRAQAAGNGPFVDTRALRDQFRAFEDIGRPLTDLKNKIEGLSTTLQAGLYPELERIQGGFQNLYRQIAAGTTTFDDQAKRVESLRTALVRLGRATAAASDLGGLAKRLDADNSGASFFQPAAKEALQRSLQLRTQAEAVPARLRGGVFADLAVSAEDGAKRIEEAAARVVRAELRIARKGATPNNLAARDSAQSALDDATRRQEVINAAFSRQLRNAQIKEVISPEAQSGAEKAVSLFRTMSDELRKVDSARFESLIASVGRVVDQFNNAQASASRAKAAIETLARANVAAKLEKSLSAQADSILGSRPGVDQAAIRKAAAMQRNQIYSDASLSPAQKSSRAALVTTEEQTRLERESFNRTVLGRVASLSSTASSLENPALAKRADDLRRNASELNAILKSVASSTDAAFRTQKLDEYKAKLYGLVAGLDSFDASAKQAAATQRQFQQFLSMSGGRGDKLDPALEGLAATIMVGRQYRGQFDQGNDLGKMAVADTIQRVEDRTNRILLARQKIEASTKLTVDQKIAAYRKLNRVLADQEEIVISSVVENSGGQRTKAEVDAAVSRAKKSSGSLGLGASSAAQLALQQGLFAIDDFMSSTGGFEYKLRAIGNNITQLGLLLGQSGLIKGLTATKGLFIALAAVVGTQAISAFARFASNGRTSEDQTKALSDALSRQKSIVDQLAQSYQKVSESIRDAGLSDAGVRDAGVRRQVEEIQRQQKESRDARILNLDQDVATARADVARAERELKDAPDLGKQIRAQLDLSASQDRQRRAERVALLRGGQPIPDLRAAAIDALAEQFKKDTEAAIAGARAAATSGGGGAAAAAATELAARRKAENDARIADLQRIGARPEDSVAAIDARVQQLLRSGAVGDIIAPLQRLRERIVAYTKQLEADDFASRISDAALRAASSLDAAQKNIEAAFSGASGGNSLEAKVASLSESLTSLQKAASEAQTAGNSDEARSIFSKIQVLKDEVSATLDATSAVRRFSESLNRASQESQQNLASAQSDADQARRANLFARSPSTASAMRQADQDLQAQRELAANFEAERAAAVERFAASPSPEVLEAVRRLNTIDAQLRTSGVLAPGSRERLAADRARSQMMLDQLMASDPAIANARDASTGEEERRQAAIRGRQLLLTDGERAGQELSRQIADLRAAAGSSVAAAIREGRFGDLAGAQQGARDAEARLIGQAQRAAAPAIFNLADSVQNAILQGPSRAALNVSDISTQDGARELNRLLRGDDSARDQNLVELQRQSTALEDIQRTLREGVNGVKAA